MRRSRLPILVLCLLSVVCVACQGVIPPFLRSAPTPSPTPELLPAEQTASDYLRAWEEADYAAMYGLLAPASQADLSEEDLEEAYSSVARAMTLTRLKTGLMSVLEEREEAQAGFTATAETLLFGQFTITSALTMTWDVGRWGILWEPTSILPQLAGRRHLYLQLDVPVRGNIYDRSGLGLATNGRRVVVGVVPKDLKDEDRVLYLLSQALDKPIASLRERYANVPPDWFVDLGDVSAERGVELYEALKGQPGVELTDKPSRVYQGGNLACHVLGHMGPVTEEDVEAWTSQGYPPDIVVGQTGLEAWGEEYLRGEWGGTLALASSGGKTVATLAQKQARQSRSIYTTLDRPLQEKAIELLKDRQGAIVALDPNNGHVLAMVSSPSYDLNLFVPAITPQDMQQLLADPGQPLVNRATQGLYPPASTFKIVDVAAVLETGVFQATSTFNCEGLWYGLGGGWVKSCWIYPRKHGVIDLVKGLTVSCDSVFYEVGLRAYQRDVEMIPRYARQFGLGQPTGIEGLAEEAGLVPDPEWKQETWDDPWRVGDSVNMGIGQGFLLVTPLQMAVLIGAVANGGTLYRPQLVWKIGGTPDVGEQIIEPEVRGTLPVSPEHLATIRKALWGVPNQEFGTAAWVFKDSKIIAAGKTGTGENPGGAPHAWFVGWAPYDNPQIAMAVLVENSGEGSVYAAPIFRTLAETFLLGPEPKPTEQGPEPQVTGTPGASDGTP